MKNMTKLMVAQVAILTAVLVLTGCQQNNPKNEVTIGIIEPLQHKAMDEIVAGYTDTLTKEYGKSFVIKIENAQNDANLERAIVQKMASANYTIIAPIGVAATQMTLSMVHNTPVVSLASDLSDAERQKLKPCNVAVVHDEISEVQSMAFIHAMYPKLTQLTLIHSSADKVLPQMQATIAAGKKYGITVHHLMVNTLAEMYTVANAIPANSQGIFILKDNMIVSGIGTLAKVAKDKHIPLITSDQGSVQGGAAIALGVHEREIGVQGAMLTAQILKGKSACSLPIVSMSNLTVFINPTAMAAEQQNTQAIATAAKQAGYNVEMVQQASS
jgi:putative ABC transport system substrate-binding protein